MTYSDSQTKSSADNPVFILSTRMLRAINDGPLNKAICLKKMRSSTLSHLAGSDLVFNTAEREHIRHVQVACGQQVDFTKAFDLIYCFGQ